MGAPPPQVRKSETFIFCFLVFAQLLVPLEETISNKTLLLLCNFSVLLSLGNENENHINIMIIW